MDQKLPQHVAIVMDGNGRWAKEKGYPRVEGHRVGIESVRVSVQMCLKKKIPYLSVFAFSSENWVRPQDEVDYLMQLFIHSIEQEMEPLHEQGVLVRFSGDRSGLSDLLQIGMTSIESLTSNNHSLVLNIVVNYGGRWDIVQASRKLASRVAKGELSLDAIDEAVFSQALDTAPLPDPDLLIRTSGECRISNFFLWQLAYSEFYFSNVYWPDFNEIEFEKALACFATRVRRYGDVSPQEVDVHHV